MANPYRVGIELAMASNHAQVLGALSHSLLGVFPQVTRLTQHFDRLKMLSAARSAFRASHATGSRSWPRPAGGHGWRAFTAADAMTKRRGARLRGSDTADEPRQRPWREITTIAITTKTTARSQACVMAFQDDARVIARKTA